jgi:hypothetical protein
MVKNSIDHLFRAAWNNNLQLGSVSSDNAVLSASEIATIAASIGLTHESFSAMLDKEYAAYQSTQYQRSRKSEYPSIGDQLDALFHAGVFPPEMAARIQEVKTKYPKPE